jgi:hypothetical protein
LLQRKLLGRESPSAKAQRFLIGKAAKGSTWTKLKEKEFSPKSEHNCPNKSKLGYSDPQKLVFLLDFLLDQ